MKLWLNKYTQNNRNTGKEEIKLWKMYMFMESVLYNETNPLIMWAHFFSISYLLQTVTLYYLQFTQDLGPHFE